MKPTFPEVSSKLQQLSPKKRALLLQRLESSHLPAQANKIPPRNSNERRVLSFGQQQLWLVDQMNPGASAYNVPYPVLIRGPLNVEALQQSLNEIVGRHEVLRTLFVNFKGQPLPLVVKQWNVELVARDLTNIEESQRQISLKQLLKQDSAKPFDLARDLKLRTFLYRIGENEHVFLHVSHHISWDLRSRAILYEELSKLYEAHSTGCKCNLPELPIQYSDYALFQRRHLQGDVLENLSSYWRKQLGGSAHRLILPSDRPRPKVPSFKGAKYPVALSHELLQAAKNLSRQNGATLYMLLLACLKAFLLCYTSQQDISVGSPFAGRPADAEPVIGMFINTLVLRTKISEDLTFREVMNRVRATTLGAMAHQELPFEKIVEAVRPSRDSGFNPLFQVNFRVQNSTAISLHLPGLSTETLNLIDNEYAKFDLALELPSDPNSRGYFEYAYDLFDQPSISRMSQEFLLLLPALMDKPDSKIGALEAFRVVRENAKRMQKFSL